MNIEYHFTVDPDPEFPDLFSVWIDNGQGSSAEVAGKIGYSDVAQHIADYLNGLDQADIRRMWRIT